MNQFIFYINCFYILTELLAFIYELLIQDSQ